MIVNLLPALRDLRSPLATGYVLISALYLAFAESLRGFFAGNNHGKYITDAATYAGTAATLAAITFIAFIIGSIWVDLAPSICRASIIAVARPFRYLRIKIATRDLTLDKLIEFINGRTERTAQRPANLIFTEIIRRIVREKVMQSVTANAEYRDAIAARLYQSERHSELLERDEGAVFKVVDAERHVTKIVEDMSNVPARLLGSEPDLWNAWDRLRSEGEFRLAMATALIPLLIVLSLEVSRWYLIAFLLTLALWVLGEKKEDEASGMLFESLIAGRVTLTELDGVGEYKYTYWLRDVESTQPPTEGLSQRRASLVKQQPKTPTPAPSEDSQLVTNDRRFRDWWNNDKDMYATRWRLEKAIWDASRYRNSSK